MHVTNHTIFLVLLLASNCVEAQDSLPEKNLFDASIYSTTASYGPSCSGGNCDPNALIDKDYTTYFYYGQSLSKKFVKLCNPQEHWYETILMWGAPYTNSPPTSYMYVYSDQYLPDFEWENNPGYLCSDTVSTFGYYKCQRRGRCFVHQVNSSGDYPKYYQVLAFKEARLDSSMITAISSTPQDGSYAGYRKANAFSGSANHGYGDTPLSWFYSSSTANPWIEAQISTPQSVEYFTMIIKDRDVPLEVQVDGQVIQGNYGNPGQPAEYYYTPMIPVEQTIQTMKFTLIINSYMQISGIAVFVSNECPVDVLSNVLESSFSTVGLGQSLELSLSDAYQTGLWSKIDCQRYWEITPLLFPDTMDLTRVDSMLAFDVNYSKLIFSTQRDVSLGIYRYSISYAYPVTSSETFAFEVIWSLPEIDQNNEQPEIDLEAVEQYIVSKNEPPEFIEELKQSHTVVLGNSLTIEFPEVTDDNTPAEQIKIDVQLNQASIFMQYSEQNQQLTINSNQTLTESLAGDYDVKITLSDEETAESIYNIIIHLVSPNQTDTQEDSTKAEQTSTKNSLLDEIQQQYASILLGKESFGENIGKRVTSRDQNLPHAMITDVSSFGLVEIKYSKPMDFSQEFDWQQDPLPFVATVFAGHDTNYEDIEIVSVNISEWTSFKIELQFTFKTPTKVSQNSVPDYYYINLEQIKDILVDEEGNKIETVELIHPIPRQFKSLLQAQQVENAASSSVTASTAVFSANIVSSSALASYSLGFILSTILFLAEVSHIQLMNVRTPANVQTFVSYIFEASKFDIVPRIDDIFGWMFNEVDSNPISAEFEAIGYETTIFMYNLGSAYLFGLLQFSLFIIVQVSSVLRIKKLNSYFERKQYKWNFFISIIDELLFTVLFAFCISIKAFHSTGVMTYNSTFTTSNLTAIVCFALILAYVCFTIGVNKKNIQLHSKKKQTRKSIVLTVLTINEKKRIMTMHKSEEIIRIQRVFRGFQVRNQLAQQKLVQQQEQFTHKYGVLFEGFDCSKPKVVFAYKLLQLARYVILSASLVYTTVLIWQVFGICVWALSEIIFINEGRPFEQKSDRVRTTINVCIAMITLYHILCFSDLVSDEETRYEIVGYSLIFSLCFIILIYMLILSTQTINATIQRCKQLKLKKKLAEINKKKSTVKQSQQHIGRNQGRSFPKQLHQVNEDSKEYKDDESRDLETPADKKVLNQPRTIFKEQIKPQSISLDDPANPPKRIVANFQKIPVNELTNRSDHTSLASTRRNMVEGTEDLATNIKNVARQSKRQVNTDKMVQKFGDGTQVFDLNVDFYDDYQN